MTDLEIISDRISEEEFYKRFLKKTNSTGTLIQAKNSIRDFKRFLNHKYPKLANKMLDLLYEDYNKTKDPKKAIDLLVVYFNWLQEDHLDVKLESTSSPYQKAKSPSALHGFMNYARRYVRLVGGIKVTTEDISENVTYPVMVKDDDPEPLTLEQFNKIVDNTTVYGRKVKYFVIRDIGCRNIESMRLTKKMITFDVDEGIAKVRLPQSIVKGKTKARDNYLTVETAKKLKELVKDLKDDDPIFWTIYLKKSESDEFNITNITRTEVEALTRVREKIAKSDSAFSEKYSHNGFHKISLHAIRAFTSTAYSKANGDDMGHGYIGHKQYLEQYIRRSEAEKIQMFKKAIPYLTGITKEYGPDEISQRTKQLETEVRLLQRQKQNLEKISNENNAAKNESVQNYQKAVELMVKEEILSLDTVMRYLQKASKTAPSPKSD